MALSSKKWGDKQGAFIDPTAHRCAEWSFAFGKIPRITEETRAQKYFNEDLDPALPGILKDATAKLSSVLRMLLAQLKLELYQIAIRIEEADAVRKKTPHLRMQPDIA